MAPEWGVNVSVHISLLFAIHMVTDFCCTKINELQIDARNHESNGSGVWAFTNF